ncbi:hypothetical protein F01_410447 [Burkholderia cenocepacia]|nr:hypothetical protein F01_410447 [Burkholderia cenocepacia]
MGGDQGDAGGRLDRPEGLSPGAEEDRFRRRDRPHLVRERRLAEERDVDAVPGEERRVEDDRDEGRLIGEAGGRPAAEAPPGREIAAVMPTSYDD